MTTNQQSTPKKSALSIIAGMKETASYEDMIYELYIMQKIEQGKRDVAEGRVYSQTEAKQYLHQKHLSIRRLKSVKTLPSQGFDVCNL